MSGNGRGSELVAHAGPVNAGESGCSDYSPSLLINFTPSSTMIIDNVAGSRPSFLTATGQLQPGGQQLTWSPAKQNKQKKAYFGFILNKASDGANTLWCAGVAPFGTSGKEDVLRKALPGLLKSNARILKEARQI